MEMKVLKGILILIKGRCTSLQASLEAQMVQNAMQETWVPSLGQEDPLEKGMATHSSILAWRIPWIEETCELKSMGSQRIRHNLMTNSNN